MDQKIVVGVVCGGQSVEHEVSVLSAKSIFTHLDRSRFLPRMIGVDKKGKWFVLNEEVLQKIYLEKKIFALDDFPEVFAKPLFFEELADLVDVLFPIIHGTYGEDGCYQGLFKTLEIPFVGPSVPDAYLCFDKEVSKRLLQAEGLLVANFLIYLSEQSVCFEEVSKKLGLPVFVKPSNAGSSVGISKAFTQTEFEKAVAEAFKFDTKIVVEEYVEGRELECSVMGYKNPIVSLPGEVIPNHEFYSYEAKYLDENGAEFVVPALLDKDITLHIQKTALQAYQCLRVQGMARVDLFLTKDSKLYINELNTLPGFTTISLFPRLWAQSNISFPEVLSRLIDYAFEREAEEKKLKKNIDLKLREYAPSKS